MDGVTRDFRHITGHVPQDMESFLKENYNVNNAGLKRRRRSTRPTTLYFE